MGHRDRIGYLVSWFPAITETFVLDEVNELRDRGLAIDVFPLRGARGGEVHGGWRALRACTHYHRSFSWEMVEAQLHWLRRRPRAYLHAWIEALRRSAPSPRLLVRVPVVLAKAALIARRLEGVGARHVHAHWATHPALAAWFVREVTGIGYSFTAHAHDIYVDTAMLREKVEAARFVVTISEFNRALLVRICGPVAEKVHVIRSGVDLAAFVPRTRSSPRVPTFVCVASLREYKGHDVLLEAIRILRDRGAPLRLRLVGDGELRGRIEARISRDRLGDRVELLGAVPHEQIPDVLSAATGMVLPSVRSRTGQMEGIPVALMEAMAAGVPVVATRLSGIPELVQDGVTGLLVPERDPVALAAAMRRLGEHPDLADALAAAARDTIRERFDRVRNLGRLEALLAPYARGDVAAMSAPFPGARRTLG